MFFVGNGGMQGHYVSMLYEQYVGIGKSTTHFMLRSISVAENLRRVKEILRCKRLPDEVPIITIETEFDNPLAAIDLHIKTSVFISELGEKHHNNNPFDPVNYSSINKKIPKNEVKW